MSGLFLISSLMGGYVFAHTIIRHMKTKSYLNELAMSTGIGFLISGWITYIMSYIFHVLCHLKNPKMYGNIISISFMLVLFLVYILKNKQKFKEEYIKYDKITWLELGSFFFLFLGILISMFYVFRVEEGLLKSGATVFSDFAPHTAMIRSFSYHNNFPTQYPHYGGVDVKYHFMFQFLTGNLEYLGMRIDWAFNWLSATSLWGFLVLLYSFTKRITGYGAAGAITIFMFFCRSSFAGLEKLVDCIMNGKLSDFLESDTFIGYTLHEDWGLWNYNVFLNQRHFALGLLIGIIAIFYFYEYLSWIHECDFTYTSSKLNSLKTNFKNCFLVKDAWLCDNITLSIIIGVILGLTAFWNGAVVIGTLLILFGFAVFAKHKLDYLITAIITLVLSFVQTNFFMDKNIGQNIGINYFFGFLAEEQTLASVTKFIVSFSGLFFIGILIFLVLMKGYKKVLIFAFLLPYIFAFTIAMTPDITVNHKYIIISTIYLNIIWSYALVWLWKHFCSMPNKLISRIIVIVLLITLTITGIYDFVTIYRKNANSLNIDINSDLTKWFKENTTTEDLILTGPDAMSEVTLSGAIIYTGWPYYAWSAGYDTSTREANATFIYTSFDEVTVDKLVKKEGIDYIFITDTMLYHETQCLYETIEQIYPCVYHEGINRVYKVE